MINFFFSPFEQFEIGVLIPYSLGFFNLSFTNTAFSMLLIVGLFSLFFTKTYLKTTLLPTSNQIVLEQLYLFISGMVIEHLGKKEMQFFPFLMSIFMFIVGANLLGMFPYSFTVTSHICVTLALSFSVCFGIVLLGINRHGINFMSCFLPAGSPLPLAPLLISIEFVSYSSHAFSLAIRLFANMLAGHALLKILAGFVWTMWGIGGIFIPASIAPIAIIAAITVLELGVSLLQAYVFTVLSCIYIKDSIHLH